MPGTTKRRNLLIVGSLLVGALIPPAMLWWNMRKAVAVVEACGGGISDDLILPGGGPELVTFDLGIPATVRDSDAPRLVWAFSKFPKLRRLIFRNTPLGDPFFTTIAPHVSVDLLELSGSRCSDAGVLALVEHHSARKFQIEGLALSEETRKLLADRGLILGSE